jgi:hypothetical protein
MPSPNLSPLLTLMPSPEPETNHCQEASIERDFLLKTMHFVDFRKRGYCGRRRKCRRGAKAILFEDSVKD